MKQAHRLILFSFIWLAILSIPSGYIHELGHAGVCAYEGYNYRLEVGFAYSSLSCAGTPENLLTYYLAGGILAAIVFFMVAIFLRTTASIRIVALSIAVGNLVAALFEGFAHQWYMSNAGFVMMQLLSVAIFAAFLIATIEARKGKQKLSYERWLQRQEQEQEKEQDRRPFTPMKPILSGRKNDYRNKLAEDDVHYCSLCNRCFEGRQEYIDHHEGNCRRQS